MTRPTLRLIIRRWRDAQLVAASVATTLTAVLAGAVYWTGSANLAALAAVGVVVSWAAWSVVGR